MSGEGRGDEETDPLLRLWVFSAVVGPPAGLLFLLGFATRHTTSHKVLSNIAEVLGADLLFVAAMSAYICFAALVYRAIKLTRPTQ